MALPTFEEMREDAWHHLSVALDDLCATNWASGTGPTDRRADALKKARSLIVGAQTELHKARR